MNRNQTIWASLDEIRIGERTVARLSAATVEQYRLWLEQGREAPPVRLARAGDAFVVRDGRHRVAAALAAGHTVIEAEVRPIGRFRALIAAVDPSRSSGATRRLPLDLTWGRALGVPLACTEQGVGSIPTVSIQASVVSTASTRPLYGRGAGSNPAGGSSQHERPQLGGSSTALRGQRALVRIQPGVLTRT